jgi:hypothetical protein
MSYSSYKKQQKLFENWRNFLKENEKIDAFIAGADKGLHDYTALLKQIASDKEFRKLALSGQTDDGGPSDEAISVSSGEPVAAKDLVPTQFDIDLEKSLGDQMINRFNGTQYALEDTVTMGSKEGRIPILVFDGKYILDGHHRWSQVVMTNPEAMMTIDNLSAPAFGSGQQGAEKALKATQLAIAALAGKVATNDTEINLLKVKPQQIANYVLKNISDEVVKMLHNAGKIKEATREAAAQMYAKNLVGLQEREKGKFQRKLGMPQAADSGTKQALVNKALSQGKVNFDNPQKSDLKK